ncbi:MAG: hypothetical protein ABI707_11895 [Ferruginibacter sp.]
MSTVDKIMQYILYSLELISCITGFIYWSKIKNSFWKWFPIYLAVIFVAEMTGNYLNYLKDYYLKRSFFNYFVLPLEFLFMYWLYYNYAAGKKRKQLVIFCTVIYLVSFVVDQLYFNDKKFFFDSFSYSIGNLVLLVAIISFFIQFSSGDEIINFKSSIIFWVSLGSLIFYLGTLPYFGLLWLLFKQYKDIYTVYSYLVFVCDWIMYSLFIVGFIWGKPK